MRTSNPDCLSAPLRCNRNGMPCPTSTGAWKVAGPGVPGDGRSACSVGAAVNTRSISAKSVGRAQGAGASSAPGDDDQLLTAGGLSRDPTDRILVDDVLEVR